MSSEKKILFQLVNAAINTEYKSYEFYRNNAVLIKSDALADEEVKHIENLKFIRKSITGGEKSLTGYSEETSPDIHFVFWNSTFKFVPKKKKIENFSDLINCAIELENKTIEYYSKMRDNFLGYNAVTDILDDLIQNEKQHKINIAEIAVKYKQEENYIHNLKNIIMFDLDGTLVSSSYDFENTVYLRPYTKELLQKLSEKYLLCIFSRSDYDYIEYTLKISDIRKYFFFIFDANFINDGLKSINFIVNKSGLPKFMIKKIIFIDDNHKVYPQKNLIKIYKFTGDKKDTLFLPERFISIIEEKFKSLSTKNDE